MSVDWMRPPHIHFKVSAPGMTSLTTQLYFRSEAALNRQDRILQRLSPQQRSWVMTELGKKDKFSLRTGQFDVVLGLPSSGPFSRNLITG